jgi:tRNA(adenine34) deaminase
MEGLCMDWSRERLEIAMGVALEQARAARAEGDLPYGAVVIDASGRIVAQARDAVFRCGDPTRHGEFEAVRLAVAEIGPDLVGHALVSNVEPCAMCATGAWWARIDLIAFGLRQSELFAKRPDAMDEPGLTVEASIAVFGRRPRVVAGVLREPCTAIWED